MAQLLQGLSCFCFVLGSALSATAATYEVTFGSHGDMKLAHARGTLGNNLAVQKGINDDDRVEELDDKVYASGDTGGSTWRAQVEAKKRRQAAEQEFQEAQRVKRLKEERDARIRDQAEQMAERRKQVARGTLGRMMTQHAADHEQRVNRHDKVLQNQWRGTSFMRREADPEVETRAMKESREENDLERTQWWGHHAVLQNFDLARANRQRVYGDVADGGGKTSDASSDRLTGRFNTRLHSNSGRGNRLYRNDGRTQEDAAREEQPDNRVGLSGASGLNPDMDNTPDGNSEIDTRASRIEYRDRDDGASDGAMTEGGSSNVAEPNDDRNGGADQAVDTDTDKATVSGSKPLIAGTPDNSDGDQQNTIADAAPPGPDDDRSEHSLSSDAGSSQSNSDGTGSGGSAGGSDPAVDENSHGDTSGDGASVSGANSDSAGSDSPGAGSGSDDTGASGDAPDESHVRDLNTADSGVHGASDAGTDVEVDHADNSHDTRNDANTNSDGAGEGDSGDAGHEDEHQHVASTGDSGSGSASDGAVDGSSKGDSDHAEVDDARYASGADTSSSNAVNNGEVDREAAISHHDSSADNREGNEGISGDGNHEGDDSHDDNRASSSNSDAASAGSNGDEDNRAGDSHDGSSADNRGENANDDARSAGDSGDDESRSSTDQDGNDAERSAHTNARFVSSPGGREHSRAGGRSVLDPTNLANKAGNTWPSSFGKLRVGNMRKHASAKDLEESEGTSTARNIDRSEDNDRQSRKWSRYDKSWHSPQSEGNTDTDSDGTDGHDDDAYADGSEGPSVDSGTDVVGSQDDSGQSVSFFQVLEGSQRTPPSPGPKDTPSPAPFQRKVHPTSRPRTQFVKDADGNLHVPGW